MRTTSTTCWVVRAALMISLAAAGCGAANAAAFDLRFELAEIEGEFLSDSETKFSSVPLEATFGNASSRFTITVPYLRVKRTGNVIMTADGPAILGAGGPGRPAFQQSDAGGDESGFGDIILRDDTYFLQGGRGKTPILSIFFDLKLPTADEKKGLGTGEQDWGVGLDYTQPLSRRWRMLATATRRYMRRSEKLAFEDRWISMVALETVTKLANYRFSVQNATPIFDSVPVYDAAGATTGAFLEIDDRRLGRVDLIRNKQNGGSTRYGVWAGLTDSTEDLGFSISWSSGAQ